MDRISAVLFGGGRSSRKKDSKATGHGSKGKEMAGPPPPNPSTTDHHQLVRGWDVFGSHVQAEEGDEVHAFAARMQIFGLKPWRDLDYAEDVTGDAVKNGVHNSRVFCSFMSDAVPTSWFTRLEISTAVKQTDFGKRT